MMVESPSPSEVLRASVILLIRLDELQFGPWTPESGNALMVRDLTMRVVILEILKGTVRQRPGEPFTVRVQQRGTGTYRVMDYYGVWSHASLVQGTTLLAFCRGPSDDAAELLSEEHCDELLDPATALEDTRAALEIERRNLSAEDVRKLLESQPGRHGDLFARYLIARLDMGSAAVVRERIQRGDANLLRAFDALLGLLEDPETTDAARASYAAALYELVTMTEPPPLDLQRRLARAMFRLLGQPAGQSVRTAMLDVYLPHLIGLAGASARRSAAELFEGQPSERAAAEQTLLGFPGSPSAIALLRWIRST